MRTRRSFVVGSDACGRELKEALRDYLLHSGYLVTDLSGCVGEHGDSLAVARRVAAAVSGDELARGILLIGGRVNVAIAANQVAGARAVYISDGCSAERANVRDHANVVVLSARTLTRETAVRLVESWLSGTPTPGPPRLPLKLHKIDKIDEVYRLLEAVYG